MNREQKAAVIDQVAEEIQQSEAIFAVDYRGISVKQAVELRVALSEAGASFQVVKNTLTERAADRAGAESLKPLLAGPTALTFVRGDAAMAAKALATFRRQAGLLEFKGGQLGGQVLSVDQIESIARLPARDVLQGQFVGVLASPITGLVRGLGSLISGLAVALGQVQEKGSLGESTSPVPKPEARPEPAPDAVPSQAPGDPVSEAEAAPEPQGDPADAAPEPQDDPPDRPGAEAEPHTEPQEQDKTSPEPVAGADKTESQEA
ncbi:MAG: hypothetical protein NVSMB25_05720 [Thermoleophilaceae bacterium]